MRKAVLDIGSNSVLLLVEERTPEGWRFVHEETAVTALGEGTKATGLLSEDGMNRTLRAIANQFEVARELGAQEIVAAATMAARIASNRDQFTSLAQEQGTPVSILSGEDEALLGFEAVAYDPAFSRFDSLTIVDPGGHSTEVMNGSRNEEGWERNFLRSFPVGTLGLKSQVMPSESPEPLEILNATQAIDDAIEELGPLPSTQCPVVVLGATGTNLISIRERLETWQPEKVHGAYLLFEEISRAVGWMMSLTDQERGQIVGMEPGREKTLHVGALILERYLFALRAEGCFVSVRGWRHALLERRT